MQQGNRRPKDARLTEDCWLRLQSATIGRLLMTHSVARLALEIGVDVKTLRNARDGRSALRPHAFANLRAVDPSAFDELIAHFGIDAGPPAGAVVLARIADVTALIADAMADGHIDHQERAEIVQAARPLVQMLTAKIAAFDRARVA